MTRPYFVKEEIVSWTKNSDTLARNKSEKQSENREFCSIPTRDGLLTATSKEYKALFQHSGSFHSVSITSVDISSLFSSRVFRYDCIALCRGTGV